VPIACLEEVLKSQVAYPDPTLALPREEFQDVNQGNGNHYPSSSKRFLTSKASVTLPLEFTTSRYFVGESKREVSTQILFLTDFSHLF
jgi:hypothetical protein